MINRLRNTRSFYISYLCLFGLSVIFYFYQSHGDFVIWLNSLHNPIWDFFFRYWTHTGSVYFFIAAILILVFLKRRYGLILSMVGIGVSLVSSFFKFVVFPDTPRPSIFFEGQEILAKVEGVQMLDLNSFPSGHAMAAFALATFIALMLQNNGYSLLLLTMACLTALSRVYLAQHFLIDIMAGSLIGIIIATAYYVGFEKYLNKETITEINTPDEDLDKMNLDEE
ncbi:MULTISPECIES: phosphatase PAP2 family protein [unclassified Ekhidna]|uniref:phosphatase PAP2 family protein n=1 Tax=unclassified Ekhidna TaxID=2632188 RepID=UPI0032DF26E9